MIRVLNIIGRMNTGGAETFIMNVYRNLDREKVQFDFVVHTKEKCDYDDEITKLGGKIYRIPSLSRHPIKNLIGLKNVFKNTKYSIVHRHTNTSMIFTDLIVAKIMGVKKIIVHSHSTNAKNPILHKIFRPLMCKLATIKYACSKEAGEWLFGRNEKFEIITNGIDIEKYKFNREVREEVRKELNIANEEILIGHVGRFNIAKNHEFLIDIFNEFQKSNNSKLILLGTGNLENKIKEKVAKLNLQDKVIFLGVRNDVHRIMQAMDLFVFPSLYEGLPLTLVEAQAAGLDILASSVITKECNITGSIKYYDIEKPAMEWKKQLEEIIKEKHSRNTDVTGLYKNGFDSKMTAEKLQLEYLKQI